MLGSTANVGCEEDPASLFLVRLLLGLEACDEPAEAYRYPNYTGNLSSP